MYYTKKLYKRPAPPPEAPQSMPLVGPALIGDAGAGTTIHRQVGAWAVSKSVEGDPKWLETNRKTIEKLWKKYGTTMEKTTENYGKTIENNGKTMEKN